MIFDELLSCVLVGGRVRAIVVLRCTHKRLASDCFNDLPYELEVEDVLFVGLLNLRAGTHEEELLVDVLHREEDVRDTNHDAENRENCNRRVLSEDVFVHQV